MKVSRYSLEIKCIFLKQWKQLAIKELTERCTRSPNSLSLKQNLVMFEIIGVTGSEMRKTWQNFTPQRNPEHCFIEELLKEIHEFIFVSLKASACLFNSCHIPATSCASCSYTHSPGGNVNQALDHLHTLLLSHFHFQVFWGTHDLSSMTICDQNNLPPLAADSPALFFYCVLPESLEFPVSPLDALRGCKCISTQPEHLAHSLECVSPRFHACWDMRRISVLLRLTLSPRCLSIPHLDAVLLPKLLHTKSQKKFHMLKGLTGIHLVAKRQHGHYQENQGLSLLVTAVMGMTCPMGFFHSHWHTQHLPETFSSKPFETLWQSSPEALPWGTTTLCSNAGRNARTSLYLPQFSQAPPTVCAVLQLKLCEIHKHGGIQNNAQPHLKYQCLLRTAVFWIIPAHVKYIQLL